MKKLSRLVSLAVFGSVLAIAGQVYLAEATPAPPVAVEVVREPAQVDQSEMMSCEAEPAATAQSTWQWQGCWGWFGTSCPYDIYRDAGGNYVRCNGCTSGTNANPGACASISTQSLNVGRWCS